MFLVVVKAILFFITINSFLSDFGEFCCHCDSAPPDHGSPSPDLEKGETKLTESSSTNIISLFFDTKIGYTSFAIKDVLGICFFLTLFYGMGLWASTIEGYEMLLKELYSSSPEAARIINSHAILNPYIKSLVDSFNAGT